MLRQVGAAAFLIAVVAIWSFCGLVGDAEAQAGTESRPPITERVDESRLITLAGNLRPEATAENDRGPVPDGTLMEHMLLQLRRLPNGSKRSKRSSISSMMPTRPTCTAG